MAARAASGLAPRWRQNVLVLAIDAAQVLPALIGLVVAALQARARNDHAAQRAHQLGEMAVLGGARNLQMELEVGRHGIPAFVHGLSHRVQCLAHGGEVGVGAALRGQGGGFGLHANAQLQHGNHVAQGAELLGGDLEAGFCPMPSTNVPMPWRVSTSPEACSLKSPRAPRCG